jgi:hypothetical protein
LICPKCKKTLPPLWDLALGTLRDDWSFQSVYQMAGAKQTYASAWVKADGVVQLNLNRWGVPKNAEILREHYTSVGQGENHIRPLRFEPDTNIPKHLRLIYGATYGRKGPPRLRLLVSLSWVVPGRDEVSTHLLVDAVKQYAGGRYDALTVPANVAVEAALVPVVKDWVTVFSKDWGSIARQYSQISVLSLIAADTLRVPRLAPAVLRLLDDLRDRRNSMGHTGTPPANKPTLTATTAGELLTAAIFGYHYARFLREAIARLRRRKGLPARAS